MPQAETAGRPVHIDPCVSLPPGGRGRRFRPAPSHSHEAATPCLRRHTDAHTHWAGSSRSLAATKSMTKPRPARAATRPEPTPDRSIHQLNQFNIAGGPCQEFTQITTILPVIRTTTPGAPAALVPHGRATLVTAKAGAFPPGDIGDTGRDARAFEPNPYLQPSTFFCRDVFFSSTQQPETRLTVGGAAREAPRTSVSAAEPRAAPLTFLPMV
jgi:hypothetical protein